MTFLVFIPIAAIALFLIFTVEYWVEFLFERVFPALLLSAALLICWIIAYLIVNAP